MGGSPDLEWEVRLGHPGIRIVGVDEVGRGCLAGPVVAGALILQRTVDLESELWIREIADSKLLTPEKREELEPKIMSWAEGYALGEATVEEIDRINIYHASHLAMVRAVRALGVLGEPPARILVDGNALPRELRSRATAVIKGDLKSLSIAAASILAKVYRDRLMKELDGQHPGYGFAQHKGYSTPAHQEALKKLGACAHHRRTFGPVMMALGLHPEASDSAQEVLF